MAAANIVVPDWSCYTTSTTLRVFFSQSDFPLDQHAVGLGYGITWRVPIADVDFEKCLAAFCDGLCETLHPFFVFARHGASDMLELGDPRTLSIMKVIIPSMSSKSVYIHGKLSTHNALKTKDYGVMGATLKVLKVLLKRTVGAAAMILHHHEGILQHIYCAMYLPRLPRINLGPDTRPDVHNLSLKVLDKLEQDGGVDALEIIKSRVHRYMSQRVPR